MNVTDILKVMEKNDIVIYGAGYVAESFFRALQVRSVSDRVLCFAVSDKKKAFGKIHDKPIRVIDELLERKNVCICIAVHEVLKDECIEHLVKLGINKYIWVTPYIFEMILGAPLQRHTKVNVNDIIKHQRHDDYNIAVRYSVIENYYKQNEIGYNVYIQAQRVKCEENTAKKRLAGFVQLIDSWQKNGYQEENSLVIDSEFRMVDGAHRLSLAHYHEMQYIYCDVFPYSENYNILVRENSYLSMQMLEQSDLQAYELEAIEKIQAKIRG